MIRDAVTFEVFRNAVTGLADEMAITILRTAHSQLVASSMDYSAALCDAQGRVIAQANTLPLHMGSIPGAMTAVFDEFGDRMQPGDIYLFNDPSLGGMHLPDIFVIAPVYSGEVLLGFSVTVVNHTDVGGWAAGSMAVQSTSIFAEGVQIPPSRLLDAGAECHLSQLGKHGSSDLVRVHHGPLPQTWVPFSVHPTHPNRS